MCTILKRPAIQATLIQAVLILVFLYTPLSQIRTAVYSPVDYTQSFQLTHVALQPDLPVGTAIKNPILVDVPQTFDVWALFDRDSLRAGQIPLWNPYNGNGMPQMAGYQEAVFSIFSVPFYLFPFKWALLLTAFAKLFMIGLFTYLFLKLTGLTHYAALFGSIAFMFCSDNIVWLGIPLTGVIVFLPMSLFFLEWLFQCCEHRGQRSSGQVSRWPLIGLTFALVIGLLGGHPETLYFCGLLVAAYTIFRLVTVNLTGDPLSNNSRAARIRLTLSIGAAVLLALAISAVQLIPFAEYLRLSQAYFLASHDQPRSQASLPPQLWPLLIYPDLLGNPANPQSIGFFDPQSSSSSPTSGILFNTDSLIEKAIFKGFQPANLRGYINFNENSSLYLGALALILAGIGIIFGRKPPKRHYVLFFSGVVLVSLVFIYNLFGIKPLFDAIPIMSSTVFPRNYPVLLFALSACAAGGLDYLLTAEFRPPRRWGFTVGLLSLGVVLLMAATISLLPLLQLERDAAHILDSVLATTKIQTGIADLLTHLQGITIVLGCGLAVLCIMRLARRQAQRTVYAFLLIGLNFISTGFMMRDFNPTVDERVVYPEPPAMTKFLSYADQKSILVIGSVFLNPNINLPYHVKLTGNYDALGVAYYDQLLSALFKTQSGAYTSTIISEVGLKLFGIDAVAITDGVLFDTLSQSPAYKLAVADPNYAVFSYQQGLSAYYTVGQSIIAASDDQALNLIQAANFTPAQTVILSGQRKDRQRRSL